MRNHHAQHLARHLWAIRNALQELQPSLWEYDSQFNYYALEVRRTFPQVHPVTWDLGGIQMRIHSIRPSRHTDLQVPTARQAIQYCLDWKRP